ncbi:MAG: hypothetical protein WKF75_10855 [Singulisphaera sp.]
MFPPQLLPTHDPPLLLLVYVDPLGEELAGGLVKAPKISYGKANQMYG